jgi:tetratricopeptide (TPR) repeat protein
MGRAFYPLTPEVAVEDFAVRNEFVDEAKGLHYRMEQRDGRFYQRQYLLDSSGRELAADEYEMRFVVGSNHHSRSYIVVRDEKWFQAPICWYPAAERWDFCPGYELQNDHFNREISLNCLQCHNGRMEPVPGERNRFREPVPHGIGCERCHGPGQLHVEYWQDRSRTPSGEPDPTIVNPRRLPQRERLSVCHQCHLGDASATERVGRPGRNLQDYRPGRPLTDFIVAFHYVDPTEHEFGLSAQADRMILSRCYTESRGRLECLTCHDPHVTVYHDERPDDYFTQRCRGCHEQEACAAPAHSRQSKQPADDCVACHMRKAEADDQRFAEFTDHWIRRNLEVTGPDHRGSQDVEPIDREHFATLSEGERAFYTARANALMARNVQGEKQRAMLAEAERAFGRAIERGYATVDAWFFLGKARQDLGRHGPALEAFRRAHEIDARHHDAAFALGQSQFARGEVTEAIAIFEAMLLEDPADAMALAELGRALTAQNRLAEALEAYERALEREPWNSSLHLNRGMLLAAAGRFDEAEEEARAAVRLDIDGIPQWEFFEKLARARGNDGAAAEARRHLARLRSAGPPVAAARM